MFKKRATESERIDRGDYTPREYATFLREIAFINRYLGDRRAVRKTLLAEIEEIGLSEFSVLDVGSGSGELLRMIADLTRKAGRSSRLIGLDLNPIAAAAARSGSRAYGEISSVRGDAFRLPLADGSVDYAISSLFFHHLTDEQIPVVLREMSRVARRGYFIVDLHRHLAAYVGYKLFCAAFRISDLVRQDGSLSIRKGFRPRELENWFSEAGLRVANIEKVMPFRIVVHGNVPSANKDDRPKT